MKLGVTYTLLSRNKFYSRGIKNLVLLHNTRIASRVSHICVNINFPLSPLLQIGTSYELEFDPVTFHRWNIITNFPCLHYAMEYYECEINNFHVRNKPKLYELFSEIAFDDLCLV